MNVNDLIIHDELTKDIVNIKIQPDEEIKIYVCGPTVYDHCHIGHGRSLIVFDILHRTLKNNYPNNVVKFVQNITDIDDKIINKAKELGVDPKDISVLYTEEYFKISNKLNILPSYSNPKVTDYIDKIQEFIMTLIDQNNAYVASDGVYFDMKKNENTVNVFNHQLEHNTEINTSKKYWKDFALWKRFDDYGYESPWGKGRPGWHIECSVMLEECCGQQVHIHGGGTDLSFPHHTNEIYQSYAKNHINPAKSWVHNGMIYIDSLKMSKSLGNSKYLKDMVTNDYEADVFRYWIMMYSHNDVIHFNDSTWSQVHCSMNKIRKYYFTYCYNKQNLLHDNIHVEFNLPNMIENLHIAINNNNASLVYKYINIYGFIMKPRTHLDIDKIHELIQQRTIYKHNKEYKLADEIRQYLIDNHIEIQDTGSSVEWHYA